MPVRFHNADVSFALKRKKAIKQFLERKLSKAAKQVEIDYIFCSDKYLLQINRQFLKHDFYTDIITFPLTSTRELLEAEVYISIERVKENSTELNTKFADEMLRVMFHGALHLIGFKDKLKVEKERIRKEENKWLNKYHLNN